MIDRRWRNDRFLEWKVSVFCIAAVIGLGGIYLDERRLTALAIALLAGAMCLRFLPGNTAALDASEPGGQSAEGGLEGTAAADAEGQPQAAEPDM